jgi:hypothetical protein
MKSELIWVLLKLAHLPYIFPLDVQELSPHVSLHLLLLPDKLIALS